MASRWIGLIGLLALIGNAQGQGSTVDSAANYPDKPIRFVISFSPGASIDGLGRIVAQHLSTELGQPVVVENRAGAAGNIAADLVAKAPPDGYTLLCTNAAMAASPALYPNLPFDPVKDLAPIGQISTMPFVLMVNPSVPAKTVEEFVRMAKEKPGQVSFGGSGVGSQDYLIGAFLGSATKVSLLGVPYTSSGTLQTDLLAGRIDMAFAGAASAMPYVTTGKVRALAVTSPKRLALIPDVPTMKESGIEGFDVSNASWLFTTAGTPKPVIAKLSAALNKVLRLPDVRERFAGMTVEPVVGTPDDLAVTLKNDIARWAKVVSDAKIKVSN